MQGIVMLELSTLCCHLLKKHKRITVAVKTASVHLNRSIHLNTEGLLLLLVPVMILFNQNSEYLHVHVLSVSSSTRCSVESDDFIVCNTNRWWLKGRILLSVILRMDVLSLTMTL